MRVLGRKKKGKKRGKQSEVGKCVLGDDSSSSSSDSSGSDSDDDSSGSDDEDETARLRKERMEAAKKIANTDFLSDDKAEVWVEKQSYVMDDIKILKRRRNKVEAIIGRGNDAEVRQLIFQCEVQAENFNSIMEFAGKLENARAFREDYSYRQLKLDELESNDGKEELAAAKDTTVNQIKILAEIVSASNLPISDSGSSDPYVSVFLGKKLIHQTKEIRRHLNPVWTMTTGSLFILRVPTEDFFKASGLTFLVFDHDVVAKDSILGKVTVPHADVLGGKGEREEYPLFTKKGRNNIFGSGIALRFRPATHDDVYFVSSLLGGQKARRHKWHAKSGIHSSTSFLPPRVKEYSLVRQEVKRNRKKKEVKFRVKPWPDPLRSGETKWMTKTELTNECMKPATHWIEVGSGGIGKLFVEILHGDDLPNFDVSHLVISAKSDFFVNLLFEDCIANTEVINE